ncbi:hypothetical protein N8737_02850 [Verrucomicrobia bacterium]|nr:hypothetical protein [Verrucomicrobiota bacterium]MDA7510064.1 hypothetical protein [Verrucomicrobiota bacterium]MDA7657620.1 hypothetical protein [Verrucomicrobiota bacterium]
MSSAWGKAANSFHSLTALNKLAHHASYWGAREAAVAFPNERPPAEIPSDLKSNSSLPSTKLSYYVLRHPITIQRRHLLERR